ncbi:MAG: glycopeptide antibiotics resistance protein [Candidatus Saccharibacteria bacterium]|nr:glycopeptide antibiotics resistance protein [Candidatus Saccharibacteria bacterium]
MKPLPKVVLAVYLLILLWLVLFKFSSDFSSVLLDHQMRSLNLVPFAGSSWGLSEMISNVVVFVPFGLLLSVNFKRITVWRKLIYIFIFSVIVEALQFILAIGVTDITDVITNTLGGFLGLMLYTLGAKCVDKEKQDWFLVVAGVILLTILILLRFLVFKVRY